MSRRTVLKTLSLLLALGLLTYLLTQPDEVSHAQTGGFDRSLYADDKPVGDLEVQDELPETGEFNVMIELFDAPTSIVYKDVLGDQSDRAANRWAVVVSGGKSQCARRLPYANVLLDICRQGICEEKN